MCAQRESMQAVRDAACRLSVACLPDAVRLLAVDTTHLLMQPAVGFEALLARLDEGGDDASIPSQPAE